METPLTKIDGSCAIIALSYAAMIDEDTALRLCHRYNFKAKRGMEDKEWQGAAKALGLQLHAKPIKPARLKFILPKLLDGLYICGTWNHVFIVDKGYIHDPLWESDGQHRKILQVWKVTKDAK